MHASSLKSNCGISGLSCKAPAGQALTHERHRVQFSVSISTLPYGEPRGKLIISEENTDLVFAVYEFGLRTGQPDIVKFIHTDSGVVSCKDSFIGSPYETNEATLKLTDGKTQSKQLNAIAKR